jgi:proteasome lid subunit RPN8/RPN11
MTSASTSSEHPVKAEKETAGSSDSNHIDALKKGRVTDQAPSAMIGRSILHGSAPGEVPVSVVITQLALAQLESHCYAVLDSELGGVLLGKVERRESSSTILVKAVLPVKTDDYGPVHFTFSADSWAILHEERGQLYPNMDIVGWYHTHPGLGVFYSPDDVVVHSAAFVLPWHVGLVIDPVIREGCWFGWHATTSEQSELSLAPITGYYELLDERDKSIVSWKLVEASIWQAEYITASPTEVSDQVYVPANDWPALPPISAWWGVLLGGISLVLTLLLLLDRLIALVR